MPKQLARSLACRIFQIMSVATLLCTTPVSAMSLTTVAVGGSAVAAGAVVPIQVFLDNGPTTSAIMGLQFNASSITGSSGASLTSVPSTPDGFDESPILTQLDFANDGKLTDDSTISLAQFDGTGIAIGSDHVLIGTFWVQTPAAVAGNYAVSLESVQLTTAPPIALVNIAGSGTTIIASVPEPASVLLLLVGTSAVCCRRFNNATRIGKN